jgi:putative flippase GtrA
VEREIANPMTQTNTNSIEDTAVKRISFRNPIDALIVRIAARFGERAKEIERFLRFAVVGASGAVIDLGLLYVLQATVIPPHTEMHVALASGIAFFTAVVSNFTWTRLWVYPDSRSRSMRRQLAMFTFVSVIGGVARLIWMALMAFPIGEMVMPLALPFIQLVRPGYVPTEFAEAKMGSIVAQLIAMVVIMLWNFFANRYWTYNDVD